MQSPRFIVLAFVPVWVASPAPAQAEPGPPRLVLQITVDQLRGDLPGRVADRFGQGGFRYLYEQGTVYDDAHHPHATTETIVGHATLATGATPSVHGMVGNVWLDRESGQLNYNIEDARYRILTAGADVDDSSEIDPTQRTARSDGRSPAAILSSTFSDELAIYTAGQAKIFGVSVKDRGAVPMAGHAGKAFWFSKANGEFVTSSYYYERYPEWILEWNAQRPADRWDGESWQLMHDRSTYIFGALDDRPYETDLAGFGRVFPHPYGDKSGRYYTTLLTTSPAGDELVLGFAKALIENEDLGTDEVPDYLSVSFSSTDYVGHLFGPSSLESEDNLLRLDRTLADLFAFVDDRVGLANTLIVLSADHGAAEAPPYLEELGFDARYVDPDAIEAALSDGSLGKLVNTYFHPYVYLDRAAIRESGLDQAVVEQAVMDALAPIPGVALTVPSSRLRNNAIQPSPLIESVANNYHPRRSGDVYVIFEPHFLINDFDGLTVATTHGSPWSYDTYVPLIFAGADVPARRVARRVNTTDVAPTLALWLGTKPPSGAVGVPLVEVFAAP